MKLHNLNKTVLSLSIYTIFLAYVLGNNWLYVIGGCMFFASVISEIGVRLFENRRLPVKTLSEIEESKTEPVIKEQKEEVKQPEVRVLKIQKDDSEFIEQKKALIKKAIDNGYKLIKEEFIPEELNQ